jgi:ribulose kinase
VVSNQLNVLINNGGIMENSDLAREVITDIANKQAVDANDKIDSILGSRVMDALALKKLELARAMFDNGEAQQDHTDDDVVWVDDDEPEDELDYSEDDESSDEQNIEDEGTDENSETNN